MTKQSEIARFVSTDSTSLETPDKKDSNRSHLSELYPTPKTYEQRKQDDTMRQQTYRRYWPKYPYVNIAAYGSALLGVVILFAQNLSAWWFGSDSYAVTMSSVFFSFAVGLGIAFLIISWIVYVNKLFSYFGGAILLFWLIYSLEVGALVALWVGGFVFKYTNILWIPVLMVPHFIIVLFSVRRMIGIGEAEH